MASSHWLRWHDDYDDPASDLAQRLPAVQLRTREAVAASPPGPIRLISVCAGQGRDVIEALRANARAPDVTALLVELDDGNVAAARAGVSEAGLSQVEVLQGDASVTTAYQGVVPANVLLLCGIFGNVPDEDIRTTVHNASRLCAPRATAVWTRHRRSPDLTPVIRGWFADAGWEELGFDSPGDGRFAVGTNRLAAEPLPYQPNLRLFTFR